MTHTIKHKKVIVATGTAMALGACFAFAHPFDANATTTTNAVKVSSKGTKVKVDDTKLQAAIAAAKKAGVKVTQETTDTQTVKSDGVKDATSKIEAGYATQVNSIEEATTKQAAANAQYAKDKAAYDAAIAKHKDDTPSAEKDGIKIYGDYNEAGKGSLDYYKNFDVVVDSSKVSELANVPTIAWTKDSKVTAVGKTDVLKTNSSNFNSPSKDMYLIKNFKKGSQYKITNVGTEKDTGKKIDAIMTLNGDVKKAASDDYYLAVGKQDMDGQTNDSTRFEFLNIDGVKQSVKFVYADSGKAAKVVSTQVIGDVDYLQGLQTNFGNITQLSPKENGLTVDKSAPSGLFGTYTTDSANLDGFNDTPKGTVGLIGEGSEYQFNFFDEYTKNATKSTLTTGTMISDNGGLVNAWKNKGTQFNLFGSTAALNIVTPPVKKTYTAKYKLTDLIVTPTPSKDVDTGENAGDKDGSDNGKSVIKGDELTYSLKATDLPADRVDDMKTIKYVDTLPKEVDYKSAKVYSKDGKTDLTKYFKITFDKTKHQFTAEATAEYLKLANADKTKAFEMPIVDVYTIANTSNAKFDNTYEIWENDDQFESNTVENTTPDIKPTKDVESGESKGDTDASIDGDEIKKGQEITYPLSVNDLPANRADDLKVFKYVDTLPKEVDYKSAKVYSKDGKNDLTKYFKISYDDKTRVFTVEATAEFLKLANADKTKAFALPVVDVYAAANKDNATIDNKYDIWENDSKTESNTVENTTPGVTPTPKPDTPATPNTSYGEAPKGWLYGAIATIVLAGAGIIKRKTIKKWFTK